MLISNKLHSFRNFVWTKLSITGEEVLKTYRTRFQIEFC